MGEIEFMTAAARMDAQKQPACRAMGARRAACANLDRSGANRENGETCRRILANRQPVSSPARSRP